MDVFLVGQWPLHYCLLEFYSDKMRVYLKAGTYKLYPKHNLIPTIRKADRTLQAAHEILDKLQNIIPQGM